MTNQELNRACAERVDLTPNQWGILEHTVKRAAGQRYCGGSADMDVLVKSGLMRSLGTVAWCPDEYFTITDEGRAVLAAYGEVHAEAERKPKQKARNAREKESEVMIEPSAEERELVYRVRSSAMGYQANAVEEHDLRHAEAKLLARIAELKAERDVYRAALEEHLDAFDAYATQQPHTAAALALLNRAGDVSQRESNDE